MEGCPPQRTEVQTHPSIDSDEVTMVDNLIGVDVPLEFPEVPRNMTLVGAIELIGADAILVVEEL
jgi:hypothetical protein